MRSLQSLMSACVWNLGGSVYTSSFTLHLLICTCIKKEGYRKVCQYQKADIWKSNNSSPKSLRKIWLHVKKYLLKIHDTKKSTSLTIRFIHDWCEWSFKMFSRFLFFGKALRADKKFFKLTRVKLGRGKNSQYPGSFYSNSPPKDWVFRCCFLRAGPVFSQGHLYLPLGLPYLLSSILWNYQSSYFPICCMHYFAY